MKRPLLLSLISLLILVPVSPLALAQKPDKPAPPAHTVKPSRSAAVKTPAPQSPGYTYNIMQLTSAEMYRYGREMYLRGNFMESARVFLQILRVDCSNRLAQYHLRKIAAKEPSLKFLNDKLDQLPCKSYDFTQEDFLPASIYYENDPDLMLKQLISYSTRHRLTEKEMSEKIDQYSTMVRELESTVAQLRHSTSKAQEATSPGGISQETLNLLEEGKQAANRIGKEIDFLSNQLASERLERQKEVQDMRTRLAAAEARLASEAAARPATPTPAGSSPTEDDYSDNARDLRDAMAQAKAELEGKERSLAAKDQALTTLQSRFDDIQRRLRAIQNNLHDTSTP